jgi:hypothetical protein
MTPPIPSLRLAVGGFLLGIGGWGQNITLAKFPARRNKEPLHDPQKD